MSHAILVHQTGGPEVLSYEPYDPGSPGPGEVRIKVAAAGVNFIDVYHRTGLYPKPLPFVEGMEGAGRVEAVGPGVTLLEPGDRVAWAAVPGSYASSVVGPADKMIRVPDGVGDDVAAAVMLQGMTAHYLVQGVRDIKPGDWAIVHAAAGGVGLLLVQMLKRAGAKVIGTTSTEAKAKLARGAGADHVVLYTSQNFMEEAKRLTAGRGADVVYDSVGKDTFDLSLQSLRLRGLLCMFGQSSGAVPPFDILRLSTGGSLFLTRPTLFHYTAERAELEWRASEVLGGVADGWLNVRIGARYPLAQAAAAQSALEGRGTTGKVILEV